MISQRELITMCRQIGGMMEAGVDILRITRVLRAQTKNERLLEFYQTLDHDLRMGQGISEALGRAPDVFSPFAVSLVRQGEGRNDLAGAFLKIADYLQQEEDVPLAPPRPNETPNQGTAPIVGAAPAVDVAALARLTTTLARDATLAAAGLLLIGALASGTTAAGLLSAHWIAPVWCALSGVFLIAIALMLARRLRQDDPSAASERNIVGNAAPPVNQDMQPEAVALSKPQPDEADETSFTLPPEPSFLISSARLPGANRVRRGNTVSQEADYE